MDGNSDHILQLEITIEQLIKERDALTAKCNSLKIQNDYQAQQLDSLRDKLKANSPSSFHSKHASASTINSPTTNMRSSKSNQSSPNAPCLISPRERTTGVNIASASSSFQSSIFNSIPIAQLDSTNLDSTPNNLNPEDQELVTPPTLQSTFPLLAIHTRPESAPVLPKKDMLRVKSPTTINSSTISLNDTFSSTRAVLRSANVSTSSLNDKITTKPAESGMQSALRHKEKYEVLVLTSCIKFPEKMREMITFIISIKDKENEKEMWRIEKSYADFCHLEEIVYLFAV